MAIPNRQNLAPGTTLIRRFKGTDYKCTVLGEMSGILEYALEDGRTFKSPSAAGSAIMGGTACNGWVWWSVEGEEAPMAATQAAVAEEPAEGLRYPPRNSAGDARSVKAAAAARAPKVKPDPKPRTRKGIKRVANQQAVPEGMTKYFCSGCMASFIAETLPEACPEGHAATYTDDLAPVGMNSEAE